MLKPNNKTYKDRVRELVSDRDDKLNIDKYFTTFGNLNYDKRYISSEEILLPVLEKYMRIPIEGKPKVGVIMGCIGLSVSNPNDMKGFIYMFSNSINIRYEHSFDLQFNTKTLRSTKYKNLLNAQYLSSMKKSVLNLVVISLLNSEK